MELVRGLPVTEYCDEAKLPAVQRLRLFAQICRAVQHAHQKGVIHRDIKPSNVLVTVIDGEPIPKVIDFGVAKAVNQRLTDKTVYTKLAQMVGTPLYMAPEQAELSGVDVDTRADVYALGVLLYELLTGTTPFAAETLREAGFDEMRRIIREDEPPRPSQRVSTLEAAARSTVSSKRGLDDRQLSRLLHGDLDWIVMKALEKDRNRRYESAGAFAADVEHYLASEPVEARPPSRGYRLRKFVRRNRGPVAAGVALVALLAIGTVSTTIGMMWALRAEGTAKTERDQANIAKQTAEEEAAISKAVVDFLRDDLLREADPEQNARDKKVTVEELLGRAAARIAGKFNTQPRVEAAIRRTIGESYFSLGDYPAAKLHLERAYEMRRRVLGEEHADTLDSMSSLVALYLGLDDLAKAEPLAVKAHELSIRLRGDGHTDTVADANNLATLFASRGEFAKAEPLFAKSLEILQRHAGEEHLDTLATAGSLAVVYKETGQLAKAESLYEKTLEVARRLLGDEHPDTLRLMNNLGVLYKGQSRFDKVEPLFVRALEARRRVLGEVHPRTLESMNNLASLYSDQGQFAKAEPLFVKVLEVQPRVLGEAHPHTLKTMGNLSAAYLGLGQYAKAEKLQREAIEVCRKNGDTASPAVAGFLRGLGETLLKQLKFAEAEPILRKSLTVGGERATDHWTTFAAKSLLGESLLGQKKYADAEPLLRAGYQGLKQRESVIPVAAKIGLPEALERLVKLYEATGEEAKAAEWRKNRVQSTQPFKP